MRESLNGAVHCRHQCCCNYALVSSVACSSDHFQKFHPMPLRPPQTAPLAVAVHFMYFSP